MGVIPPVQGFLSGLRQVTSRHGALLIFDEVITGFRLCYGGAQKLFGVQPDLTTLGKIIGGGLPVAAYGGRKELMEQVAPLGPVYQAGTLSGNPLAMRAGIETLKRLASYDFYDSLERKAKTLADAMTEGLSRAGIPGQVARAGSLLTLFFTASPVENYAAAKTADTRRFAAFFQEMLRRKILLAPSQFEALFVSAAHSDEDIRCTAAACLESLAAIRS
jgi:glutamate-1-semialdehyde 2,1-aminomutase